MSETADNGRITFTVKELLAKVDQKLDAISGKLDAKAESYDLAVIDTRVALLEKEASEVRVVATALQSEKKTRFTRTEKIAGIGFLLLQFGVSVAALGPDVIK